MNLKSELKVQTPEGVTFSFALAGPVARCAAWAMDAVFVAVLVILLYIGSVVASFASRDIGSSFWLLGYFILSVGYCIVLETFWRGQTLGKRMMRLRVVDMTGLHLQFHQVLIRNLLRIVDALPFCYLIGGAHCFLSKRAQRLGDLAAGTLVVHYRQSTKPDLEQLMGGKYNSLRAHHHLAARLRQRISPEEGEIALQALLRREQFATPQRFAIFAELSAHFQSVVAFPPETAEAVSDEQYVRNVVDILFNSDRKTK